MKSLIYILNYFVIRFYVEYSEKAVLNSLFRNINIPKDITKYLISGTINDNYIPKDNYNKKTLYYLDNNNNEYLNGLDIAKYSFLSGQIGFKSFVNFIKPFVNNKNCYIDYFNRYDELNIYDLIKEFDKTFKNGIYKFTLSNIALNKLNKNYLFFKNELNIDNNIKVSIIRYDEFLKNIPIKTNYSIYNELNSNFYNRNYKKHNFLLNSFIVIVEKLDYDKKHNIIFCNKIVLNDLINLIEKNSIKIKSIRTEKLYKDIMNSKFTNMNKDDKKDELKKELKKLKKELKKLNKSYDNNLFSLNHLKLKKEHGLLSKNELNRLNQKINLSDELYQDILLIQDELNELNEYLVLLDKKDDKFVNNIIDEKINYSLKLKSYL